MFDQLRPPTDNIYKFIALSGLALFLAAGWAHLKVDIELMKINRATDAHIRLMGKEFLKYLADGHEDMARDVRAGKIRDKDALMERQRKLLEGNPPNHEQRISESFDLLWTSSELQRDNYYERILLRVAIVIGLLFCIVGFILWYRLVQRPLDELLRAELEEKRAARKDS